MFNVQKGDRDLELVVQLFIPSAFNEKYAHVLEQIMEFQKIFLFSIQSIQ